MTIKQEIEKIVAELNMLPHPEGGYYSEVYRSPIEIPGKERQLMTSIYFLLTSDNVSNFHRIKSDELWFHHAGSPITVHVLNEKKGHIRINVGSDILNGDHPQALVKGGEIFGSSVDITDSYALVSCVVAPGFDFQDFELLKREALIAQFPEHQEIITRLTAQ
jgi:predicted cupin superfamily sugar epimerase